MEYMGFNERDQQKIRDAGIETVDGLRALLDEDFAVMGINMERVRREAEQVRERAFKRWCPRHSDGR